MNQLGPDAQQMRILVKAAADLIIDFLANISNAPAAQLDGYQDKIGALHEPMPEAGASLSDLINIIQDVVIDCSVNTAGPTYQAYIPGGGLFTSAVAEFIAAAINRYVGVWGIAPGGVEMEASVVRWFCNLVGYDEKARGILTSGGSMANFSAIVAARRALLPENFLAGIIYTSDQAHQSIQKAALLAGFPPTNIRSIASDKNFRLRADQLAAAIDEDYRNGKQPFLIVGSAGTTNTGAVDPIDELARIAEAHRLWLHIDAAYGGFFLLTERGRELYRGIERADSVTLDPHKALFLPYGTGCLVTRNGEALKRAHQVEANYLQDLDSDAEQINFNDYSPELTRSFRGLRVWLPLKLYGASVFREYLDEKLDLAQWACQQLKLLPDISIIAAPQLSVVAFRYRDSSENANQLNRQLLERVNATRRTFISSTTINGRLILRIALLCFRTHKADVEATLSAIRAGIEQLS
jgi:aromatic-L-amino-acid decarboxylase